MFRRKTQTPNMLDYVPRRLFGHNVSEDGIVVIDMPRWHIAWMQKYLVPRNKHPYIRISLDRFGSSCWLLMDGNITVHEMALRLEQEFGEEIHPVHERLGRFLRQLRQRGFIALSLPAGDTPGAGNAPAPADTSGASF